MVFVSRQGVLRAAIAVALVACASPPAAKKPLGEIPNVTTTAEPEWLPFAIRAGRASAADAREQHLRDLREITTEGDVQRVAWTADGKHLVIQEAGPNDAPAFFVVDLGTGGVAPVSDPAVRSVTPLLELPDVRVVANDRKGTVEVVSGSVSPDRARIAWLRFYQSGSNGPARRDGALYVGSVSEAAKEARNAAQIAPEAARTPAFAPDSRRLAFACDVDDPAFQIYLVDLDAPRPEGDLPHRTRVTFAEGGSEAPAFSPDGKHLAFVSRRQDHRASAPRHVFVARWLEEP